MARVVTLRDFILRYPSSSLSPVEKEALRHARSEEASESPYLLMGMAVTDGSDESDVPGQDTAPPSPAA